MLRKSRLYFRRRRDLVDAIRSLGLHPLSLGLVRYLLCVALRSSSAGATSSVLLFSHTRSGHPSIVFFLPPSKQRSKKTADGSSSFFVLFFHSSTFSFDFYKITKDECGFDLSSEKLRRDHENRVYQLPEGKSLTHTLHVQQRSISK